MAETEALGILATLLVLVSFLFKDEKKIRVINLCGAVLFVLYGLALDALSVWILNGALIIIHICHLARK